MKKIIILLAISLCAFNGVVTAQTFKKKVAVYLTGDADGAYKKVVGSKIVTGVTRSNDFVAVERTSDFLAELTKEQDYQMSGAVSDNQIAKLGQQFGVKYVLIADVSELFGSLFISARMVDVQTAQIISSTEVSDEVTDMNGLTKIAEDVVLGLIGVSIINMDDITVIGPYSYVSNLHNIKKPEGYRVATKDEIDGIIKNYELMGKKISYPIYTDIYYTEEEKTQNFTSDYYSGYDGSLISTHNYKRQYMLCTITYTIIKSKSENSMLTLSYGVDEDYGVDKIVPIRHYDNLKIVSDVEDMSSDIPHIEAGYVYVIKKK